jgi:hypothetical protein
MVVVVEVLTLVIYLLVAAAEENQDLVHITL